MTSPPTLLGIPPDCFLFYHPVSFAWIIQPTQTQLQILHPSEKHHGHIPDLIHGRIHHFCCGPTLHTPLLQYVLR